jgi:hypothetical protein
MSVLFYSLALLMGYLPAEAHKLTCIAKYESAFDPAANNSSNKNGTQDHGILQINDIWFGEKGQCRGLNPYLPKEALSCARVILKYQGWTAWAAYNKYKQTCDNYDAFKDK